MNICVSVQQISVFLPRIPAFNPVSSHLTTACLLEACLALVYVAQSKVSNYNLNVLLYKQPPVIQVTQCIVQLEKQMRKQRREGVGKIPSFSVFFCKGRRKLLHIKQPNFLRSK